MCVCPLSASSKFSISFGLHRFSYAVRCLFIFSFRFIAATLFHFRRRRGYKCSPFRDDGKDCATGSIGSAFIRYCSESGIGNQNPYMPPIENGGGYGQIPLRA